MIPAILFLLNSGSSYFLAWNSRLAFLCQAILILDAAFPTHLLSTLYTVLAVTQNDTQQDRHAPITRLADINSLEQLCEMLDRIDYLKGHYTLLPNVSETGNSTILRSGFAGNYASMPCVGGYLDGSVTQLGTGNRTIIEGKNKEYGFKALGLFQTSDNRQEDSRSLEHIAVGSSGRHQQRKLSGKRA